MHACLAAGKLHDASTQHSLEASVCAHFRVPTLGHLGVGPLGHVLEEYLAWRSSEDLQGGGIGREGEDHPQLVPATAVALLHVAGGSQTFSCSFLT
jgi:hypothetical protein